MLLRIQYERGKFQFLLDTSTPKYIETMPIPEETQDKWRQATEDMAQGVARRNLARPSGERIASRNLHKWSN